MNTRPLVLALASLLLVAGLADAQTSASPTVSDEADALVLANHALTVTFHGKAPDLHLAPTASGEVDAAGDAALDVANSTAGFGYAFTQLVEYRDLDSNGAPSPGEVVAALDLAEATGWEANLTQENASASVALTLSAPVELAAGATGVVPTQVPAAAPNVTLPDRTATVTLTFTLYATDVSLLLGGDAATMPASSVHVDLLVSQWPAMAAGGDTRLALLMDATGEVGVDQGVGNVTGNATSLGALSWSTNATGETTDGAAVDVPVTAKAITTGEVATSVAFVYDAAGLAKLDHDATVGLAGATMSALDTDAGGALESVKNVPGAPAIAALFVAGLVAVAARRR